jgi:hypothetical protein
MKTACEVAFNVRSRARPYRASPESPQMVEDAQKGGNGYRFRDRWVSASGPEFHVAGGPVFGRSATVE